MTILQFFLWSFLKVIVVTVVLQAIPLPVELALASTGNVVAIPVKDAAAMRP